MRRTVYVADFDPATDTADREIDPAGQLEFDMMVYLNILPAALFRLLYTTNHETVSRLLDFDLVILEVSTRARRTDDLHLRRRAITIDDFDWATNARHLNTRSRRQLVRLVKFVALSKVVLRCRCSESCPRRSAHQHHHARKQCRNHRHLFTSIRILAQLMDRL